jgi:hypothetical protein
MRKSRMADHIESVYATSAEAQKYLNLSLDQLKALSRDGLLDLEYVSPRAIRIPWDQVRTLYARKREYDRRKTLAGINKCDERHRAAMERLRRIYGEKKAAIIINYHGVGA